MGVVEKNGPELGQDGVDLVEGRVDLLADLCTRQDDLARDEDEEDNLGLDHPVNQPREQLHHHPKAQACQFRSAIGKEKAGKVRGVGKRTSGS